MAFLASDEQGGEEDRHAGAAQRETGPLQQVEAPQRGVGELGVRWLPDHQVEEQGVAARITRQGLEPVLFRFCEEIREDKADLLGVLAMATELRDLSRMDQHQGGQRVAMCHHPLADKILIDPGRLSRACGRNFLQVVGSHWRQARESQTGVLEQRLMDSADAKRQQQEQRGGLGGIRGQRAG